MSKQTALITGATGLLGRQVLKAFERANWQAIGTGFSRAAPPKILKCDLTDSTDVAQLLDDTKPHVVVHCAAERFPDKVEKDPHGARRLNVAAVSALASLCSARDALLIYISTDYVFPGVQGEAPYAATASPRPTNLYGQTKLDGEHVTLESSKTTGLGIVLRVPVLYGETEPKDNNKESAVNILLDAVSKAERGETSVQDDWSIRYPTNTEDVGRVCADIASKFLKSKAEGRHGDLPKVLQFTAEERFTKYEICKVLAEILGYEARGLEANKQGNDPNAKVQRPYDCHLSTAELKALDIDVTAQDFRSWWRRFFGAYRK